MLAYKVKGKVRQKKYSGYSTSISENYLEVLLNNDFTHLVSMY